VALVLDDDKVSFEPEYAGNGPANRAECRFDSPSLRLVVAVLVLLLLVVLLSPAPTAATGGASMISAASGQTIRNACKAFFLS